MKELYNTPPEPYSRADYKRRLLWMELQRREGDRRRTQRTVASLEKLREERTAEQDRLKSGKQLRPPVFVMGRLLPDTEIDTLQDLIRFTLVQEREDGGKK